MEVRRGKCLLCAATALILLVPGAFLSGLVGAEGDAEPSGTWTLALYVDADCNLEPYWENPSLAYLCEIPESEGLRTVAIVDYLTKDGADRIEIEGGEAVVREHYDEEMNFGDGATFSWFLNEVNTYYEADHLVVIPWNHGSAWGGFCVDDTSDGDRITLEEMEAAIVEAGVYIDILAFDACACSSIEMAYSAARTELVGLLVASEELVAGDGFPYHLMFDDVANDPSRTPYDVACDMVDGWKESYGPLPWAWYCALGVVDITEIAESADIITAWVEQMTKGLPAYTYNYRMALRDSYYVSCGSHYQVDMVDLGRHLMDDPVLAKNKPLMQATEAMVDLVDGAVKYIYNTDTTAAAGGLSVYWGSHNQAWRTGYTSYLELPFAEESGWGEFLFLYNSMTAGWMRISK